MTDYISKNEVLNLIMHNDKVCHYADERYENVVYATACRISDVVANMSAAEVQPIRHGRWKYYKNNGIIDTYICTNCQGKVEMAIDVEPSEFKYCPNCGADMRGDTD